MAGKRIHKRGVAPERFRMALKIGSVKRAVEIPKRNRVGGGGRTRGELMTAILGLTERDNQLDIEYVPDEKNPNTQEAFNKFASGISSRLSNARSNGVIDFEVQTMPDWETSTVSVYRLSGELAEKAAARREKLRATLAAKSK